jgi:hypothetical protein
MSLRDTMLCSRIAGKSLHRAKCSLTGHAALKLPLHFACGALFEWVGAAARGETYDREQDREGFHLPIL